MAPLVMLWTDIRILLVDTTRVWWKLLPKILAIYLLGWLGYELAFKLAVIAGDWTAWASLVIFAAAFVSKLAAIVLILRLAGNALGVRRLIPADEYEEDDRDSSVGSLLAITLLPFLGIYTAFGEIVKAADQLTVQSLFRNGVLGDRSILSQLRLREEDATLQRYLLVAGIVVGAYVLRRIVDLLHERTGFRPLGIVVAFIEAFFVLVALLAGADIIAKIRFWVEDRQIFSWLDTVTESIGYVLAKIEIDFPAFLTVLGNFITDVLWPVATAGLAQPLFWLAIAALVYGSSVISVAELWRKGKPLASRVRVAQRVIERQERRAASPSGHSSRVLTEVKEAFFGDIDDKYMPTLNSLRLILRAGLVFLGGYVLVYAGLTIVRQLFNLALNTAIGGHPIEFWVVWGPLTGLIDDLMFEPWRLCLLAAALQRCLTIFRMRAEARGTLHPAEGAALTAQQEAEMRVADRVPERVG